jgi:hypothetical protein
MKGEFRTMLFKCKFVAVVLLGAVTILGTAPSRAQDKGDKGKVDPASAPLELKIKAKKNSYVLDLGGKNAKDFRKELETTNKMPAPPQVDLELELRNTGDKEIQVLVGGDETKMNLDLQGPAAVSANSKLFFTTIFIMAKSVVLPPGKSTTIPVKSLAYGHRNASKYAYWLEPGQYSLTATYVTGVSPPPQGSKEKRKDFGTVTVTSAPIKLMVEAK